MCDRTTCICKRHTGKRLHGAVQAPRESAHNIRRRHPSQMDHLDDNFGLRHRRHGRQIWKHRNCKFTAAFYCEFTFARMYSCADRGPTFGARATNGTGIGSSATSLSLLTKRCNRSFRNSVIGSILTLFSRVLLVSIERQRKSKLIFSFKIRLSSIISDDVDEDPTGNKALWDRGLLNGASQKADVLANFHVGEICMSLQKATLIPGGSESLVYTTLSGTVGVLVPFTSREDHDFFQHLEMHMRSENPPLCGRDHLSFRSYYYPVKVRDGNLGGRLRFGAFTERDFAFRT